MTSSLEKVFTHQFQMQRKTLKIKLRESRGGTLSSLEQCYVMTTNYNAADNFIAIMKLQAANGCSDASVFYKKPEIASEMESVLAKCVEDYLIKEMTHTHLSLD